MGWKKRIGVLVVVVSLVAAGAVAGAISNRVKVRASGPSPASISCPAGMSRLGHTLAEDMSIFEFDPAVEIELEYTVAADGFRVEDVRLGSHAGTHLDVPNHFIEGARSLEDFAAEEFVWPVYKIDVRGMTFVDNMVQRSDIRAYEREHGKIRPGSLVVLQTGAEAFWGAEVVAQDADGNSANVDDFFDFENAGFSAEAVQWLFDARHIDGVGSDAYGPDAAGDDTFGATFTTLLNDGVALVALANLDTVSVRSDIIMAPTVALEDGSGFATDPIACHGDRKNKTRPAFKDD